MDSNIARILKNSAESEVKSALTSSGKKINIDLDLVENLSGPALIINESLEVRKRKH